MWGAPKQSKTRYGVKIPLARAEAKPRRPARQEQNPAKKFSFPFRRKNRARAKSEMQRKLFCWTASEASGGGLASLVPFKVGSSKVQNFPQKCLTGAG